jgi:hypothetical protein
MKININDVSKMDDALNVVQKNCKVRTIDIEYVKDVADIAEKKLEQLGIPKKERIGCMVELKPERVANSYSYPAEGTAARIRRGSERWFLVAVSRTNCGSCPHGGPRIDRLYLSDRAAQAAPTVFLI